MKKIVVVGGGGHARVVLDAIAAGRAYRVVGVTDPRAASGSRVQGVPVLGSDGKLPGLFRRGVTHCIVAVGGAQDPSARPRLAARLAKMGFSFVNVVHPAAVVSPRAILGQGIYVAAGAIINAGAEIGDHAIINTNACVDHDCRLGAFVHAAPGAALSGGVVVGEGSHLGTGCAVSPSVRIGARTIVGVGSAVVSDIPAGAVAFGNPCRVVKRNK